MVNAPNAGSGFQSWIMSLGNPASTRFIADRMLGTLTRYLRFMGYDVKSANTFSEGNRREDTLILQIAKHDQRVVLTRDRELARRGGEQALLITSDDPIRQFLQLVDAGLLPRNVVMRMERCSLCNTRLRPATEEEIENSTYAPLKRSDLDFFWCPLCHRLYWMGSHGRNLARRLQDALEGNDTS